MPTRTYTESEVIAERNKSFADGMLHAKPSQETEKRLASLEAIKERDEDYHRKMLIFMTRHETLPQAIEKLSETLEIINNWKIQTDTERTTQNRNIRIFWTVFGTLITGAISTVIYTVVNLDNIIDDRISKTPVQIKLSDEEIKQISNLIK